MARIGRAITGGRNAPLWLCSVHLALLLLAASGLSAAEPVQTTPAMGRLNIEGTAVESIRLEKRIGHSDAHAPGEPGTVRCPGPSISLPTGEYLLQQINLKGGYSCNVPFGVMGPDGKELRGPEWFTISRDKPCSLKIGAPLKPSVRAIRRGPTIIIAYELLDSQGRGYVSEKRDNPPRFTVSDSSGREIAAAAFEYG